MYIQDTCTGVHVSILRHQREYLFLFKEHKSKTRETIKLLMPIASGKKKGRNTSNFISGVKKNQKNLVSYMELSI